MQAGQIRTWVKNPQACEASSMVLSASDREEASMSRPRFIHDDIVRLTTGQIGTVKEVHQNGNDYVYGVQLRTEGCEHIDVPEADLELVKIANGDETVFHIRYIS
jgi:hypothetical protein